jgi:hypothetical protein
MPLPDKFPAGAHVPNRSVPTYYTICSWFNSTFGVSWRWGEFPLTALRKSFPDSGLIVLELTESNVLFINKQNIVVPIAFDNSLSYGAKNM